MSDEPKTCDCGEETYNADGVCRDCGIEKLFAEMTCVECGQVIYGELALTVGMQPLAHTPECVSGASDRRYGEGLARGWAMAGRLQPR